MANFDHIFRAARNIGVVEQAVPPNQQQAFGDGMVAAFGENARVNVDPPQRRIGWNDWQIQPMEERVAREFIGLDPDEEDEDLE